MNERATHAEMGRKRTPAEKQIEDVLTAEGWRIGRKYRGGKAPLFERIIQSLLKKLREEDWVACRRAKSIRRTNRAKSGPSAREKESGSEKNSERPSVRIAAMICPSKSR
jgi:hypothetical protein